MRGIKRANKRQKWGCGHHFNQWKVKRKWWTIWKYCSRLRVCVRQGVRESWSYQPNGCIHLPSPPPHTDIVSTTVFVFFSTSACFLSCNPFTVKLHVLSVKKQHIISILRRCANPTKFLETSLTEKPSVVPRITHFYCAAEGPAPQYKLHKTSFEGNKFHFIQWSPRYKLQFLCAAC